jgi:hypothetical protein
MSNENNSFISYFIVLVLPILCNLARIVDIKEFIMNYIHEKDKYITKTIPYHECLMMTTSLFSPSVLKVEYSDVFYAIQEHVKSLENVELNSQEMMMDRYSKFHRNNESEDMKPTMQEKYYDILYTKEKILIENENMIYYELVEDESKNNAEEDPKENNMNRNQKRTLHHKNKKFVIMLSIRKQQHKNCLKLLTDFTNNCVRRYREKQQSLVDDMKLYVFTYTGCEKSDNVMQFYFEKSEHDPSVDLTQNVFFDGREKYMNYLSDFVYDASTKKSRGYDKFKQIGDKVQGSVIAFGPPGEGKTTILKATPIFLQRHLIKYSLHQFKTNEEMEQFYANTTFCGVTYSRHQLCFCSEDIDAYNNNLVMSRKEKDKEKENDALPAPYSGESFFVSKALEGTCKMMKIEDGDKPNLQTFLNITDGIKELTGIFFMFSTNYFEKLDSALVRDGRIDIKLHLTPPSRAIMAQIIEHRFGIPIELVEKQLMKKQISDCIVSTATIIKTCKLNMTNFEKCLDDIQRECVLLLSKKERN